MVADHQSTKKPEPVVSKCPGVMTAYTTLSPRACNTAALVHGVHVLKTRGICTNALVMLLWAIECNLMPWSPQNSRCMRVTWHFKNGTSAVIVMKGIACA